MSAENVSKTRVVIDTQLFLRAVINLNSLPARIIFKLRDRYDLLVADEIIDEIQDVLYRPKVRAKYTHLTDELAEEVLSLLHQAEHIILTEIPPVSRDPKDDIFLARAREGKAHYLVSEDQDLLVLHPYEGIPILNALDFLNQINNP